LKRTVQYRSAGGRSRAHDLSFPDITRSQDWFDRVEVARELAIGNLGQVFFEPTDDLSPRRLAKSCTQGGSDARLCHENQVIKFVVHTRFIQRHRHFLREGVFCLLVRVAPRLDRMPSRRRAFLCPTGPLGTEIMGRLVDRGRQEVSQRDVTPPLLRYDDPRMFPVGDDDPGNRLFGHVPRSLGEI